MTLYKYWCLVAKYVHKVKLVTKHHFERRESTWKERWRECETVSVVETKEASAPSSFDAHS